MNIFKLLLAYGADCNTVLKQPSIYTTPMLSFFETLIDFGRQPKLCNGYRLIVIAIVSDNNVLAKKFIDYGIDVNEQHPATGCTALHYAFSKENKEMVEYLIDRDADMQIKDKRGKTCIEMSPTMQPGQIIRVSDMNQIQMMDVNKFVANMKKRYISS